MQKTDRNEIVKITPVREEERKSSDYLKYLEDCVNDRIDNPRKIVYNEGKPYASLIMATLMKNTHKTLLMYCTGLRPGILCGKQEGDGKGYEGAYWDVFKSFFKEKNVNKLEGIKIMIQNNKWIDNMPFKVVRNCKNNCPGKIEVRKINNKGIRNLSKLLQIDGKTNFAVFDGTAYRIEYDPDHYLASCSFNDPEMCAFLSKTFEEEFNKAEMIF